MSGSLGLMYCVVLLLFGNGQCSVLVLHTLALGTLAKVDESAPGPEDSVLSRPSMSCHPSSRALDHVKDGHRTAHDPYVIWFC